MEGNNQLELANQFVKYTNCTIFLTGKAGTGKTTFLRRLKKELPKRMVVVAPTGVAAINAGGVTIHSFFQLPFGPILPGQILNESNQKKDSYIKKYRKDKINLIKSMDLLIIDEISMVRADLLDGIDEVLRKFKNRDLPFGGTQVLMIGDLQQLPPVVKNEEWQLLHQHYKTPFFFSSKAFQESKHVSIELQHVYRQNDEHFIGILNEIRDGHLSEPSFQELEKRYHPNFSHDEEEGYITLTTHNARAQKINENQVDQLGGRSQSFSAQVDGTFPEYSFPTDEKLSLKVGAQVMFVKNDSSQEKRYFNGKIGHVESFKEDTILVKCEGDSELIEVTSEDWQNIKYSINEKTKEIEEEVVGKFSQYPLKLAWSITIHKSQGLTFEKAIIDAQAAFAHGQVYVALSRCKTLEGLVLKSRLNRSGIICDQAITNFTNYMEANPPKADFLEQARQEFQFQLLEELFSFKAIFRIFSNCYRQLHDHQNSIHGTLVEKFESSFSNFHAEVNEIAEKFTPLLQQFCSNDISEEKREQIHERIKKACSYFYNQMNKHVISILIDYSFDTDNQTILKLVTNYLKDLEQLTNVKQSCLKACETGFEISNYLDSRAKAILQKAQSKAKKKKVVVIENVEHPVLLERLKDWRKTTAEQNSVPIFFVASQKSLIQISNQLPYTSDQLKEVNGFGKTKIERYGMDVIKLVTDYRQEKGLGMLNFMPEKEVKAPKVNTKEISYEMYLEGKSVREIAVFRDLTQQTIEKHLSHYLALGELDIDDFVEEEKRETIYKAFQKQKGDSLNQIKERLGKNYSYSELRFVQAWLQQKKQD